MMLLHVQSQEGGKRYRLDVDPNNFIMVMNHLYLNKIFKSKQKSKRNNNQQKKGIMYKIFGKKDTIYN